jgi:hypothetical protein
MMAENARVLVINGSSDPNLGERTAAYLKSLGVNVTDAQAGGASTLTALINHTGKPYTMNYLVGLMNIQAMRIELELERDASYDIVLTLGNDWAINNPMSNP